MSTSINDLPTDTIMSDNIQLSIRNDLQNNEQNTSLTAASSVKQLALDQTTISQIVNGLQQASITGATSLPNRDIPMNQQNIIHDEQIQPNYIPQPQKRELTDYIEQSTDEFRQYNYNKNNTSQLDNFYDTLQLPLLIAVLYFLFQLPIFKQTLFKYTGDFLFHKDGNANVYGLLVISILFGLTVYSASYIIDR